MLHSPDYTYDGPGRLTRESRTGGLTLDYTYDASDNRVSLTYNNGVVENVDFVEEYFPGFRF